MTPDELKERRKLYLKTYIQKNYNGDIELWKYHQCQKKLERYYNDEEWKNQLNDKRKAYYKEHKKPKPPKALKTKTEKQMLMDEKLKQLKVI